MPESKSDSSDASNGEATTAADFDQVPAADESLTDNDAPASGEIPSENVRKAGLFGMSRWMTIALVAFVTVIAMTIAAVVVATAFQDYNEARAHLLSEYQQSFSAYEESVGELESSIATAEREALTTSERQLTDPSLLAALKEDITDSKDALSAEGARAELDEDGSSNEELEAEALELGQTIDGLETSIRSIEKATGALTSDKEAKRVADEEARRAAELAKKKASATKVGYEKLFRAGDSVAGTYYRFEGKIIQDAGSGTYRVNMTKDPGYSMVFWEDTILVMVTGDTSQRLLEDDIISFVAMSAGIHSYETIFGATVELPAVLADGADVAVTGRDS